MITSPLKVVYVALPMLRNERLGYYEVAKIDNYMCINDIFHAYTTKPNIYNLEHWFCNQVLCNQFIYKQNNMIDSLDMIDYYMHRFNLSRNFVLLNYRALQKFAYSCNISIKKV